MTIASALTALNQDIIDARTAIVNKGGTVTSNGGSSQLATNIATIPSNGEAFPLARFKNDSKKVIGTHFCNFIDGNGNKYKVILLDAKYRAASLPWCSNASTVTNLPLYSNMVSSNLWNAGETATANTQLIIDYCTANGYTTACTHCRSKSFTIGGVKYYGQLPNAVEALEIAKNYNALESMDTTASSYSDTNFSTARTIWSSSQYSSSSGWFVGSTARMDYTTKTNEYLACPVLEIPF